MTDRPTHCTVCAKPHHHSARNPICLTCRRNRICVTCAAPVSEASKGECRACANRTLQRDPGFVARQAEGARARNTDPQYADARKAKARKAADTRLANPALVAQMREHGRVIGSRNIVHTRSPEVRAKAGKAVSATRLAHITPEYRELYRLHRKAGDSAAEALAKVEQTEAADVAERAKRERMERETMSPFERQMERLNNGARLIEKRPLRSAEPGYTLGGVASGML